MTAPLRVRSRDLDWATRLRDEDGSTLLLTIFYGFLALVLILLVVAATSLYLERKRLFSLADGAALVGAEAFALDAVALTPQGPRPTLHSADVADAVDEYLRAVPGQQSRGGYRRARRIGRRRKRHRRTLGRVATAARLAAGAGRHPHRVPPRWHARCSTSAAVRPVAEEQDGCAHAQSS